MKSCTLDRGCGILPQVRSGTALNGISLIIRSMVGRLAAFGNHGSGVGFYEEEGVFPDFILWLVAGTKQRIVFNEPHGLLRDFPENFKIHLWKCLADYTAGITKEKPGMTFDAWIISPTVYNNLKTRYAGHGAENAWRRSPFHEIHIAFEDEDYVPLLTS